ncbi:uncharacterized protein BJX67DRAFT_380674 [Aspergillus lucknowensis]|uniref:Uncharacterized protein n=1 Tax=Aspergillus lucknowensis TaxID=176173 RepID=A0ABR4LT62_9EURO
MKALTGIQGLRPTHDTVRGPLISFVIIICNIIEIRAAFLVRTVLGREPGLDIARVQARADLRQYLDAVVVFKVTLDALLLKSIRNFSFSVCAIRCACQVARTCVLMFGGVCSSTTGENSFASSASSFHLHSAQKVPQ